MRFGVSTFLWVSPFDTHAFDLAYKVRDMGFDIIEVPVENKTIIDWGKLKDLTAKVGLEVTISGAFGSMPAKTHMPSFWDWMKPWRLSGS
jgi:D-psicose/D-tagatose/L-ribulose 3-epimerase